MSSRSLALDFLFRYDFAFVLPLYEMVFHPLGLSLKTAERALANLLRDKLIRTIRYDGKRKLYAPTAKAARLRGLDERRYSGAYRPQAMVEHLSMLAYCWHNGHELWTAQEFERSFRNLACAGMSHSRYYVDKSLKQPLFTIIAPDFGGLDVRRILTKCRREIERRKQHKPWQVLIYHGLFAVTVITATQEKAQLIREALQHETFVHSVVVVPEIVELSLTITRDKNL